MDDILCIDDNLLKCYVPLKPSLVGSLDMYLGTKSKLMQLHNKICAWSTSPFKYVQDAVRIHKQYVTEHLSNDYRLSKKIKNLLPMYYCPELNMYPVL